MSENKKSTDTDKNMNGKNMEKENTEKENIDEEEKRKKRIYEIEKKLGRHNENEKRNRKRNNKLIKYFALATNMVYILSVPVLLMMGFYMLLKKFLFKTDQPIVLVVFLVIGAVSGYWSLIKQINNIK
jgi:hypothetical protein cdivTM_07943